MISGRPLTIEDVARLWDQVEADSANLPAIQRRIRDELDGSHVDADSVVTEGLVNIISIVCDVDVTDSIARARSRWERIVRTELDSPGSYDREVARRAVAGLRARQGDAAALDFATRLAKDMGLDRDDLLG